MNISETTNGKVKMFFLPTYSPHLNPVELVWNNIKSQGIARYLIRRLNDCGDNWDHIAIDAESRLELSVVPGKRTAENCLQLVEDVRKRTDGRTDLLLTSNKYGSYQTAIEKVYAIEVTQPKKPGPGRPSNPKRVIPNDLCYATVRKTRKKGRVVDVKRT